MITWILLNSIFRIGIVLIVCHKLMHYRDMFNAAERIGMGVGATGALLTVPVLILGNDTMFEDWASCLMSFGWFLYLCGRMTRHWRHARNQRAQRMIAEEHFAGRQQP
jgi:hypothetical protein